MKATGIIRRIDELGRLVIPKEIRKTYKINDGDPLEMFLGENGSIIIKRYSLISGFEDVVKRYGEALHRQINKEFAVCNDVDEIVYQTPKFVDDTSLTSCIIGLKHFVYGKIKMCGDWSFNQKDFAKFTASLILQDILS